MLAWQALVSFVSRRKFYALFRSEASPINSCSSVAVSRLALSNLVIARPQPESSNEEPIVSIVFRRETSQATLKPSLNGRRRWDARPN